MLSFRERVVKIYSINNSYKVNSYNRASSIVSNPFVLKDLQMGDVVSFSAKKYDADSIINPTNHCAYCGCKVYTEPQIDSIAKEILSSKADRLEGKVKSVLEKLDGAKHSQEIALAKRLENEEQIAFFTNFLDVSSKKSFLKGEAIFEQVYNLEKEDAFELVKKNLHPLQRTIDHVSPQNEEKENNSSDVNLVEACYCCNHDLKKGVSFNEFYTMFPSIKNNMPKEKFEYAMSQLLDSSQTNILQRLSASNMLKHLERLFIQRTEAANYLDSIDFRIKGCKAGIAESVNSCKQEIADKQSQIIELEAKFEELNKDPEYVAMLERYRLTTQLDTLGGTISSLRERRQRASSSLNEIRNPKQSKKQQVEKLSKEEKEARIATLKSTLETLGAQIAKHEEEELNLQIQLEDLDKKFPTIETLQQRKNRADSIFNAHVSLNKEKDYLQEKRNQKARLISEETSLSEEISSMPEETISFNVEEYSQEEQELFARYQALVEAITYIDEHPNGNNMKSLINTAARKKMSEELDSIINEPVIIDYKSCCYRSDLEAKLQKVTKEKEDVQKCIERSEKQCEDLGRTTSAMTMVEASETSRTLSETVRRLTEKQNYIKIPQRIATLYAEITLLNQTIQDLIAKQEKIDSSYGAIG